MSRWGVWVEWDAYNPGIPRAAGKDWHRRNHDDPVLFDCERDALQYAAHLRAWFERNDSYRSQTIVQARLFGALSTWERVSCEPDLSALGGWFRS